jgi:hypothetical protein
LTNLDASGQRASIPYDVIPGLDNRMPRRGGGIQMVPPAGREQLLIEFTPCIPVDHTANPAVAVFSGTLASCMLQSGGLQYAGAPPQQVAALAGEPAASLGKGRAKAMSFIDPPMTGVAVAAPQAGYAAGGSLQIAIDVNHLP